LGVASQKSEFCVRAVNLLRSCERKERTLGVRTQLKFIFPFLFEILSTRRAIEDLAMNGELNAQQL
jgi:hypothetical protein